MRTFERYAAVSAISMTEIERAAHIDFYRARSRELVALSRRFVQPSTEAAGIISSELVSLDRMLAILEDDLT
jgi:hypothetical protein